MSRSDSISGSETLSQLMDGEWQDVDRSACVAGICDDGAQRARWARWHLVRDVLKSDSPLGDAQLDPALNLGLCDRIRAAIDDEPCYSNVVGFGSDVAAPVRPTGFTADSAVAAARSLDPAPDGTIGVDAERERAVVRPTFRQGAVGFALAASVAVATVSGLSLWQGGDGVAPAGSRTLARAPTADAAADAAGDVAGDASVTPATVASGTRVPAVELVGNTGSFWVSENASSPDGRSLAEARLNLFLSRHLEQAPSASREGLLPYSRLVGYDERSVAGER